MQNRGQSVNKFSRQRSPPAGSQRDRDVPFRRFLQACWKMRQILRPQVQIAVGPQNSIFLWNADQIAGPSFDQAARIAMDRAGVRMIAFAFPLRGSTSSSSRPTT